MVIRELLQKSGLARLDAEVLLAHVIDTDRNKLLFMYQETVAPSIAAVFSDLAEKAKQGCPIAHLTGEKEFYSLPFYVTPDTLIPRPDTELLAEWGIQHSENARVLDLCCGTGCIGITAAVFGHPSQLTLADISKPALAVAEKNAARHGVRADFLCIDILKEEIPSGFDLILSNPPYIENDIIVTLEPSVRDFEPFSALSGGEDGLLFYPVIIEKAYRALNRGGHLGLEIGYTQGEAVKRMMLPYFSEVTVSRDLGGNPRVVTGIKNK